MWYAYNVGYAPPIVNSPKVFSRIVLVLKSQRKLAGYPTFASTARATGSPLSLRSRYAHGVCAS